MKGKPIGTFYGTTSEYVLEKQSLVVETNVADPKGLYLRLGGPLGYAVIFLDEKESDALRTSLCSHLTRVL